MDIRKLEGVPTINALMETDGVRLDTKAADYTRKDIASCSVTKDNQANAEISVSQSSQRTSIAGVLFPRRFLSVAIIVRP